MAGCGDVLLKSLVVMRGFSPEDERRSTHPCGSTRAIVKVSISVELIM